MAEARAKQTEYLLIAAAALGLAAAMWSALGVSQTLSKYDDAIAVVDGVAIPRSVFETAIEGLASAKRNPMTGAEKREALERIIDEELLLQRAIKLGLPESDPPSRKSLVNAMLQLSVADAAKLEPTDDDLAKFYAERPKLIAPQPMLSVHGVSFDKDDPKAGRFKDALAQGQSFDAAAKASGGDSLLLPGGLAIPAKIAEYAGATVRDTALGLTAGQTSGPVEIGRRVVFVHVAERVETPPPPLAEVRAVVADEWRKRKTEEAFENYLKDLRSRARVSYASDAPK